MEEAWKKNSTKNADSLTKNQLRSLVDDALNVRIEQLEPSHGECKSATEKYRDLHGRCAENAAFLAEYLSEQHGLNPRIVHGVDTRGLSSADIPKTPKQAKKQGLSHYWVRVQGMFCELLRDPGSEPRVQTSTPEDYEVLSVLSLGERPDEDF